MREEVKCSYCKRVFPVEADACKADEYMQCQFCCQTFKNPFYKEKKDEAGKV